MNYFTLFGLPVDYVIDSSLLTARYQQLQRKFHPDRYSHQVECERIHTIQYAATINQAYQTLKYPLKRAEYILLLQGLDLGNKKYTMHDKKFLTEQLVLREELNAIHYIANPQEELTSFAARITQMFRNQSAQMLIELEQYKWEEAAGNLCKLLFLDKLQQQIKQIEEKILGL